MDQQEIPDLNFTSPYDQVEDEPDEPDGPDEPDEPAGTPFL
jgi:hypothetical protein